MTKVVVSVDGACEPKNPGTVPAYGFVIQRDGIKVDEGSGVVKEDAWNPRATNFTAEYHGLIKALEELFHPL